MKLIRYFFQKARTPIQRVGAVLICAAVLVFIGLTAHWQFSKGFINVYYTEESIPKPGTAEDGSYWDHRQYQ